MLENTKLHYKDKHIIMIKQQSKQEQIPEGQAKVKLPIR
jgi:hypothetical protein